MRWIFAVSTFVIFGVLPACAWANCALEARNLRMQQRYKEAEQTARECVEERGEDPDAWVELSRALAAREKVDEGLELVEQALEAHGDNEELLLMKARLLAWNDEPEEARKVLESLPEDVYENPEAMRLRADVSLWAEDYDEAIDWYNRYDEQSPDDPMALFKRGQAYRAMGETDKAKEDLERSCDIAPEATNACEAVESVGQEGGHPNFYANVHYGYSRVVERLDGWTLQGEVGTELNTNLTLKASWKWLNRPFGDERLSDWRFRGVGHYKFDFGPYMKGGGGYTPDSTFSPVWNAFLEGGWSTERFSAGARYWHVEFENTPVEVVNPNVELYFAPFMVEGRYFLAFEEGGEQIYHSAFARGFYFITNLTQVFVGAGLGDKSDFLEPRDINSQSHWLVTGGGRYMLTPNHRLMLSIIQRHDQAGNEVYEQTETLFGYEFRF